MGFPLAHTHSSPSSTGGEKTRQADFPWPSSLLRLREGATAVENERETEKCRLEPNRSAAAETIPFNNSSPQETKGQTNGLRIRMPVHEGCLGSWGGEGIPLLGAHSRRLCRAQEDVFKQAG